VDELIHPQGLNEASIWMMESEISERGRMCLLKLKRKEGGRKKEQQ
jgi:hypothetical protein